MVVVVDFNKPGIERQLSVNEGVSAAVISDSTVPGGKRLEVRVLPFSKHKNQWPLLVLDKNCFASTTDLSAWSKLSTRIQLVTEGIATLRFLCSTLPNDGGRNVEGEDPVIPGGTTAEVDISLNSLEVNDPSSINFLYFQFPAVENEVVYRIDPIVARYDASEASPREKLDRDALRLSREVEAAARSINWRRVPRDSQPAWKERLAATRTKAAQIRQTCETALVSGLDGKYRSLRVDLDFLAREIGQIVLADKGDFYAWGIDSYRNILKDEAPDLSNLPLKKIEVKMARNEFRDAVFMVSACRKDLRVEVDVRGDLPRSAVLLQQTLYLKNRRNQETGDALAPIEDSLFIPKGESRQVRLRFDSRTSGLKAGNYRIKLALRDRDTGQEDVIPVALTVWDFDLPSYDVLPNNTYALFDNSEFRSGELLQRAVAHMKLYGLNIVFVHPTENPRAVEVDDSGNIVKFDTAAFENRIRPILRAWNEAPGNEKLRLVLSLSGDLQLGCPRTNIQYPSDRWKKMFAQWLSRLQACVRGMGIPNENWIMAIADESSEAQLVNLEIPVAEIVKSTAPDVRLICNTSAVLSDPLVSRQFFDAFDVFQPNLDSIHQNPHLLPWLKRSNKTLWTYHCQSDLGALGKNIYAYYRVYAWEAMNLGFTGIGVWTYCGNQTSPWTQPNPGHALVFKSRDGNEVLHSPRFEIYREGADDFRYVCKLRSVAQQSGSRAVQRAESLIREATEDIVTHPSDTSRCEQWRKKIAERIVRLHH